MDNNLIQIVSHNLNLKKLKKYKTDIFTIFSQRKVIIEKADTENIDTEITIKIPKSCTLFVATNFEGQEIQKIIGPCKKRLWLTLLNQSYFEEYILNKGDIIGYIVIDPPNAFKVEYIAKEKPSRQPRQKNIQITIFPKTGRSTGKNSSKRKKISRRGYRRQTEGFLNRYDFAYAGRDTVNQVGKAAPKITLQATREIDKIAKQRINQIIRSGSSEIERVAPKIIRGAIEEVYKTPFRLLGNLGKKQFRKIKRKLFK